MIEVIVDGEIFEFSQEECDGFEVSTRAELRRFLIDAVGLTYLGPDDRGVDAFETSECSTGSDAFGTYS